MRKVFGRETVYVRCGGSIPIVGLFEKSLRVPSVLMGFGLPDDNIHAPNEKLSIANFSKGIDAVSEYFRRVGRLSSRCLTPLPDGRGSARH
jgi:acetylornithine deacetylase/succinyl-diaminopimelate desuccinylase-like protein